MTATSIFLSVVLTLSMSLANGASTSAPGLEVSGDHANACVVASLPGPEYYRIDLVPTRRLVGSASVNGYGDVYFASSPFGVALTSTGHYAYDLKVEVSGLRERSGKEYVLWVTSPSLDEIHRIGPLVDGRLSTRVEMNKYLVVLTLEDAGVTSNKWQGPVVMRGMSRSGLMHTMAGHGPFESEPCAQYGYR